MRNLKGLGLALLASLAMSTGLGCSSSDDDPSESPEPNGDIDSGTGDDDAGPGPTPGLGIDSAPEAKVVSSVDFEEPVTTTVAAGPYVFALYADKDCGVLDLSDPEEPIDRGRIETPARIVGVAYDEGNQLAYLASEKGDVLAIDMSIPGTHTQLASLNVSTLAGGISGLTRVGDRLFALAGNTLQPLGIARDPVTKAVTKIELQPPVTLDEPATVIDAGGGNIFLGDATGKLRILSAPSGKSAPEALGSVDLGGEIKGLVVRGSKVLGIANGAGLKAIDFYRPEAPKVLFESDELSDASGIRVFGTTLVVGLDRGAVSTLDISRFDAVRAVTTNKGELPAWISISRGQLFFGDDEKGHVANVPPFISGRVTGPTRDSFPLKGLVPVTLSKEIDPASVSPDTVKLSCDGQEVKGTPTVMPLQHTFVFKPAEALPTGAKCKLDLSGVRDRQGTLVSAPADGAVMEFTTASEASKRIVNPGSKFPHTTDGKFTDLIVPEVEGDAQAQVKNEGEWSDVTPAKGMYTYFYADFDGEYLWLMNDWFYGGENIEPDCYNQFHVWTGGGSEWWDVRAYGDQHVEVRKNGELIDPESDGVEGGAFYGPSPNSPEPHTMYEIRVPASEGAWGVQLHDPGPTFNCHVIEQEPHPMQGDLRGDEDSTTTSIDISEPVAPDEVTLFAPFDEMTVEPPVKLVWQTKEGLDFTIYQVQVATDDSFTPKSRVLDVGTYGSSLDIPSGLLKPGETYYWHVIAWNTSGSTTSATHSFTVLGESGEEPDGGTGGSGGGDGGTNSEGWTQGFSSSNVEIQNIAVSSTPSGGIVIGGKFYGQVDFGAGQHESVHGDNETGFFAKFDNEGNALWSKQFGESWGEFTKVRVAIGSTGEVYAAGTFEGTINLGGDDLKSAGSTDVFLAKFASDGSHVFSKRFGGISSDEAYGLALDHSGKLSITGYFAGDIDFGGETLTATGLDVFVARFTTEGDHDFSDKFGDDGSQWASGIAATSTGGLVVVGTFGGTMSCQDEVYESDVNAGFVMNLDASGKCQWVEKLAKPARSVAVVYSDEIVVMGDATVTKLGSGGLPKWEKVFTGSPDFVALTALSADRMGNPAVCGNFRGDLGLDGESWSSTGKPSALFLAFGTDGNITGSKVASASSSAGCSALTALQDGSAHLVAGQFYGDGFDLGHGPLSGGGGYLSKLKLVP